MQPKDTQDLLQLFLLPAAAAGSYENLKFLTCNFIYNISIFFFCSKLNVTKLKRNEKKIMKL